DFLITMKKLKLNQIEKSNLTNREMNCLTGGNTCGCACYKDDIKVTDWDFFVINGQYNYNGNLHSPEGVYGAYIPEVVIRP
ncbi:MAG: TIGR04149 family rSAM-modified RiPP, partial [Mucinivorans sp.]